MDFKASLREVYNQLSNENQSEDSFPSFDLVEQIFEIEKQALQEHADNGQSKIENLVKKHLGITE